MNSERDLPARAAAWSISARSSGRTRMLIAPAVTARWMLGVAFVALERLSI
jgi:hypothetical protein